MKVLLFVHGEELFALNFYKYIEYLYTVSCSRRGVVRPKFFKYNILVYVYFLLIKVLRTIFYDCFCVGKTGVSE